MIIENLFDSHVHLVPTGQIENELPLKNIKNLDNLKSLKIEKKYFRQNWLIGFGWDEYQFHSQFELNLSTLDQIFPSTPIYFSRCDGHAAQTNTVGLELIQNTFGESFIQTDSELKGLFKEEKHYLVLEKINPQTTEMLDEALLSGMTKFHRAGFTHIREMGGTLEAWERALELEAQKKLKIHIIWNFVVESPDHLETILSRLDKIKTKSTPNNKFGAVKLYFDGSLGSDTALISQPYAHLSSTERGLQCWTDERFTDAVKKIWSAGLDLAVHTIGDQAVDKVVDIARKVSAEKYQGKIHLEHVEIIRPETIKKMKGLHMTCHLQPCHWLTDRNWFDKKIPLLKKYAFPWAALEATQIPFYLGSDSPIEECSLANNIKALAESAQNGIAPLKLNFLKYHTLKECEQKGKTLFEEERIVQTTYRDEVVFSD